MFSTLIHRVFGKSPAKKTSRKGVKVNHRKLCFETLESRELLAVSGAEFATIRSQYADLNLSANMADYNVIEITAAELSSSRLQTAMDAAGRTVQNDLIVVRTTESKNSVSLSNSLNIGISAADFGSVTLVALGDSSGIVPLTLKKDTGVALSVTEGTVALAGLSFVGNESVFNSSTALPNIISASEKATVSTYNVGFFWQGEQITYTDTYIDGTSRTFVLSEEANIGFTTPYTWSDKVVLSSNESFFLGDTQFATHQSIYVDVSYGNFGDKKSDVFSLEILVDGKLISSIDTLTLDAWQLGGLANVALGTYASGTYSLEVIFKSTNGVLLNPETTRFSTSFTVINSASTLDSPANVKYEWDANYAEYLLSWDRVSEATRYIIETTDSQGNVRRDYLIGSAVALGKQNLLESGCTIKVFAQNALGTSAAFTLYPQEGDNARGAWPDAVDPYNITDIIRTSGNVQRMSTSTYSDVSPVRVYTSVPDQIYVDLIRQACARWEEIITQGLVSDSRFSYLGSGNPIDDLRIEFGFIDYGEGSSILGTSYGGTARTSANGGLPVTSTITYSSRHFTAAPTESNKTYFYNVVLHEIGHSLGYSASFMAMVLSTDRPLSQMSDITGFTNYYYATGLNTVAAFNAIFGSYVPFTNSQTRFLMETIARSGSYQSHLSEVYGTYYAFMGQHELMNWQASYSNSFRVSTITIGVLDDLGYSVDYAMADPFGSYAPTDLKVTNSSGTSVSLSWNAPSTGAGVTVGSYRIERLDTSSTSNPWTVVGTSNTTTYTDSSIVGSTNYEYRVIALNTTNVTSDVGVYSVASGGTLSWTAVSGATNYTVYRLSVDTADNQLYWEWLTTTANMSYAVPAIGYTTYYHVVANGVTQATSQASRAVRVTTAALPAPMLNTVTATSSSVIAVTWTAVPNATGYTIQYSTSSTFASGNQTQAITSGATTSTTLTGLSANTTYYVRILAQGNHATYGDSLYSAAQNTLTYPSTPTNLRGTAQTANSIFVAWDAPVGGAASYKLEWSANGTSNWTQIGGTLTGTSYTHLTLTANTTYHYRVTAVNATGNSTASTSINTLTYPDTPTNFHSTAQTTTSIMLAWDAPTNGAVSYKLEWSANGTSSWTQIGGALTDTNYTHLALTPNSTYYYRVTAVNATGNSAISTSINAKTLELIKLTAPTLETISATNSSTISVTWSTVTNAASYTVQYATNATFTTDVGTQNFATGTTSGSLTGLTGNTTYYVRIIARGNGTTYRDSDSSESQTALTYPSAPGNLRSTAQTPNSITLAWNVPTNGAASYKLEYSADGTSNWMQIGTPLTGTSYTHSSLTANTTYYYRVTAVNTTGDSALSASISQKTLDLIKLSTPTLGTITSTSSSTISVTWSAVTNAAGYTVQYATNSSFTNGVGTQDFAAGTTSGSLTGLEGNTTYYVHIRAKGDGTTYSDSNYSTSASATTQRIQLIAPNLMVGTLTSSSVALSWDPIVHATSYTLERSTNGSTWTNVVIVTGNSTAFTGLTANTAYQFRIKATDSECIDSAYSTVSATTKQIQLATPTLTVGTITTASVSLTWGPIASATGYVLERSTNGSTWTNAMNISGTNATITGLSTGTTYQFRIKATASGYADSDHSGIVSATTKQLQLSTPSLTVGTKTSDSVALSWGPISSATGYTLERSIDNGSTWANAEKVAGTSTTISGLAANTAYQFRIKATATGYADSNYSTIASATTEKIQLVAPSLTVGTITTDSVALSWDPITHATSYILERSTNGSTWTNAVNVTGTSTTITGLSANTAYQFRIKATASGYTDSAYSANASATTTVAAPVAPVNFTSTAQASTSATLGWTAQNDLTSYTLEYKKSADSTWTTWTAPATTATSATITGLTANTAYNFRLTATNASGSANSTANATTLPVPTLTVPANLRSTSTGKTAIQIEWNKVVDATEYVLQRKGPGDSDFVTIYTGADAKFSDTNRAVDTTYQYQVQATNGAGGTSSFTTAVSVKTLAAAAADVPMVTGAVFAADQKSATVTWDNLGASYRYQIYRNGVLLTPNAISANSLLDTNPAAANRYIIVGYDVNAPVRNQSMPFVLTSNTIVPEIANHTVANGKITLNWDLSGISNVQAVRVYRNGILLLNTASAVTVTDQNPSLSPRGNYEYILYVVYQEAGKSITTFSSTYAIPQSGMTSSASSLALFESIWSDFDFIDELNLV